MHRNHMNPRVEYVSARVRPKKENQKHEKICVKKHTNIGLEKGMEQVWKNLQKLIKKGCKNKEQILNKSMRQKENVAFCAHRPRDPAAQ